MTVAVARAGHDWLSLREPADATARSASLVDILRPMLPAHAPLVIHDLGCGTGSMRRWLSPQLPSDQHWIQHDRDTELLSIAALDGVGILPEGSHVTHEVRESDITRMKSATLADASLLTASALLDMFAVEELARFVDTCLRAPCPSLITLSVVGRVELAPSDPQDARITQAFNDHQRRATDNGPLLGPDAVGIAVDEFTRHGADVHVRPSPWRLDTHHRALARQWFDGWYGAACEQDPALADAGYAHARREAATHGRLSVTVHHLDVLVRP